MSSLGFISNFSSTDNTKISIRKDWIHLLEEVIIPMKKPYIHAGSDLGENISARIQDHVSIEAGKEFILLFLQGFDKNLDIIIACFAEKLSATCLEWLVLLLSYGKENASVLSFNHDSIKKEQMEKNKKSLLIVKGEDDVIKGYSVQTKTKIELIKSLVVILSSVFPEIEKTRDEMLKNGEAILEKRPTKPSSPPTDLAKLSASAKDILAV